MGIVDLSLRRPVTIVIIVVSILLAAGGVIKNIRRDILPDLGLNVIYVAEPFGGMTPAQMEGYLTYRYEQFFLYLTGLKSMESHSAQGISLVKLTFTEGTNMKQAMGEVIAYASRARAFMPPGTFPPFILRFDASDLPVGDLVFESKNEPLSTLVDLAFNRVRPMFGDLPGVMAPAPFGASPRTIVVEMNEKKMREYDVSPEDVARAVTSGNVIVPSGNMDMGTKYPLIPLNSPVTDIQTLGSIPVRLGTYPTVFVKDVAKIRDTTDIPTGFALVNGARSVYIPIAKHSDSSTLKVVDEIKANLWRFREVLPKDIKLSYAFDQSGYVKRAIGSLAFEGGLGAILTSLMVLLFLQDWRSALIVAVIIPISLAFAMVLLYLMKQTINIMTLGGLALAVGILVDECTVTIENIHSHLDKGKPTARASLGGTSEVLFPNFLAVLCVLAVFIPSFVMKGVAGHLFLPLSVAVGAGMIGSYIFSSTLAPILATWLIKPHAHGLHEEKSTGFSFDIIRNGYRKFLEKILMPRRGLVLVSYFIGAGLFLFFGFKHLGLEIFPQVDTGEFRMVVRCPTGSTIEYTEKITKKAMDIIKKDVGANNVKIWIGLVGMQTPDFALNNIYQYSPGPEMAYIDIGLRRDSGVDVFKLEERLRKEFAQMIPDTRFSFEPNDILSVAMSEGEPKPVGISVSGPFFDRDIDYGKIVQSAVSKIPYLKDIETSESFDYPTIAVNMDRRKAGILGVTAEDVGKSLGDAAASSRYTIPSFWADPKTGISYEVQVEVPQDKIKTIADVRKFPVPVRRVEDSYGWIAVSDMAQVISTETVGAYDRLNMQRSVNIASNIVGADLGTVGRMVRKALNSVASERPKGVAVHLRGQILPLEEILNGFSFGLALSVVVIFLLLSANFQSITLTLAILSTVPAVLSGVVAALLLTHTTINIESFMGAIMSVGVAIANAVLLADFADRYRKEGMGAVGGALEGATTRFRPILMTALAMIAGMIPMASGLSEGGKQTAPLGLAVIGGMSLATVATLLILPLAIATLQKSSSPHPPSLHPDDPHSPHYDLKAAKELSSEKVSLHHA